MMKFKKEKSKQDQNDLLRAGLILRTLDLFNPIKKNIEQIYSLINTYIPRRDYQVIKSGLNAIYSVVFKYIDIRNGTFFPSTMIQAYDLSSDSFLNDVFEKLSAIQRVASKDKDMELSKECIECFAKIAIKCIEIRYRATSMAEYTHCMLAVQYMQQSIEDSLNADLLDIGINGSQSQKNIGLVLIAKSAQTDIRMIIENLSKITMYGIAKPNAVYLISYPLQAYSLFLRAYIFYKDAYDEFLPQTILRKVQNIADLYVKFKDLLDSHLSVNMQYALGDFIDLSNKMAMPYIFSEAYKKIIDTKTKKEDKEVVISKILKFGHDVWSFYDVLSKSAAEKQSFLIHFIDAGIHHISMSLLSIYQSGELDDSQKKKALEDIRWVISDYWRIYDYHKTISNSYELQILDHLLELGYSFNTLNLEKELDSVIGIVISIAESFLEKQQNSYGFDPIRILEKAIYLCILNGSDQIKNNLITRVKEKFWKNFTEKYPQLKDRLFEELSRVDPLQAQLEGFSIYFEDTLVAKLKKQDIDNFTNYLKETLSDADNKKNKHNNK